MKRESYYTCTRKGVSTRDNPVTRVKTRDAVRMTRDCVGGNKWSESEEGRDIVNRTDRN